MLLGEFVSSVTSLRRLYRFQIQVASHSPLAIRTSLHRHWGMAPIAGCAMQRSTGWPPQ